MEPEARTLAIKKDETDQKNLPSQLIYEEKSLTSTEYLVGLDASILSCGKSQIKILDAVSRNTLLEIGKV